MAVRYEKRQKYKWKSNKEKITLAGKKQKQKTPKFQALNQH